jgi:hypothetical protein
MRKKCALFFVLICIAASGAFAQWATSLYFDFDSHIINFVTPTGMLASTTRVDENNATVPNTGTTYLDPLYIINVNTPGQYYPKGGFNLFQYGFQQNYNSNEGFAYVNDSKFRLFYDHGILHAWFGIGLRHGIQNYINSQPSNRPVIDTLLGLFVLDELRIIIDHPLVSFYIGTILTENDTTVRVYDNMSAWSRLIKSDYFAVMVLSTATVLQPIYSPLMYTTSPLKTITYAECFNFIGTVNLLKSLYSVPVLFDFGMSVDTNPTNTGTFDPSQLRFAGGAAVKGRGVFDLIDYELLYKVRGGDPTLDDSYKDGIPGGKNQPDGKGATVHYLSLGLGLPSLIPDLGLSFAYNVMFPVYEDEAPKPDDLSSVPYKTTKGPVYHGIDLRMRYLGIPETRVVFQNNVSFGMANEPVFNPDGIITGQSLKFSGTPLDKFESQKWFALYNALSAKYAINRTLSAYVEFVHRLGITTDLNSDNARGSDVGTGWGKSVRLRDILQGNAFIHLDLSGLIYMQAGLSVWFENSKTTFSDYLPGVTFAGPTSWQGGGIGFGVPVRLVIHF